MLVRRYIWPLLMSCVFINPSCQKEITGVEESQGANFNRLLKTVTRQMYGNDMDIITYYSYNAAGQVAEIKRTFSSSSGSSEVQKDVYYRTAGGRLDSIVFVKINPPQDAPFHNVYKTEFYYTVAGNIIYSVNRTRQVNYPTDSTVYNYTGNVLSQRIVYRKPYGSTVYTATITFTYQYDATGNVSDMNVVWSGLGNPKSCTFTYDNKPNTLPVMEYENELYGNWIKAFDNNFSSSNNLLTRRVAPGFDWDWGNMNYEYSYLPNNKPVRQRIKNADGPGSYDVLYYYD